MRHQWSNNVTTIWTREMISGSRGTRGSRGVWLSIEFFALLWLSLVPCNGIMSIEEFSLPSLCILSATGIRLRDNHRRSDLDRTFTNRNWRWAAITLGRVCLSIDKEIHCARKHAARRLMTLVLRQSREISDAVSLCLDCLSQRRKHQPRSALRWNVNGGRARAPRPALLVGEPLVRRSHTLIAAKQFANTKTIVHLCGSLFLLSVCLFQGRTRGIWRFELFPAKNWLG